MQKSNAAAKTGASQSGSYRLHPKVTVSRTTGEEKNAGWSFLKHGETGRLLRIGPEDGFLLDQLDSGKSPQEIAAIFSTKFGRAVRPATVESFARQMVSANFMQAVDEAEVKDASGPRSTAPEPVKPAVAKTTPAKPARAKAKAEQPAKPKVAKPVPSAPAPDTAKSDKPVAEVPEEAAMSKPDAGQGDDTMSPFDAALDDDLVDEDDAGGDTDLNELEGMVFGGGGFRRRPRLREVKSTPAAAKPAKKSAKPKAKTKAEPEAAAPEAVKDQAKPDSTKQPPKADAFARSATPDSDEAKAAPEPDETATEEAARLSDPRIANRKVKFARNRGGDEHKAPPGMIRLFDPTGMLETLNDLFGWYRHVQWLLYPLVIFAALVMFNRMSEFGLGVSAGFQSVSRIGFMLISLLTVNFFGRLVVATVAHRHGAKIHDAGLTFLLFVIPRFAIDLSGVQKLEKEGKLAVYAAGLKVKLFLFASATVVWAITRQSQTMIPDIAIIVESFALLTFLIGAFPLMQGDGYKWMSTYFDQPLLRQRAYNYVFGTNKQIAQFMPEPTSREKWAFAFYAIGSALVTALIVSLLLIHLTTALEGRYGGAGLVILVGIVGAIMLWLSLMKKGQKEARKGKMKQMMTERLAERQASRAQAPAGDDDGFAGMMGGMGGMGGMMGGMGGGGMMGGGMGGMGGGMMAARMGGMGGGGMGGALMKRGNFDVDRPRQQPLAGVYAGNTGERHRRRWFPRMIIVAALSTLAYLAFLPYGYEVGGDFTILPDQRTAVNARVPGELIEIYVDEGDLVEAGQQVAKLSDLNAKHQVASVQNDLEKAQARLEKLLAGAAPEDIALAQEQVAGAAADIPYREAQATRALTLLERGAMSEAEADRYQKEYMAAQQDLKTAEANLAKVSAPATEADIRMAEADVKGLEADLQFAVASLAATEIKAPVAGRVVTENVALIHGKYMDAGDLFIEIENHETARAEVLVSETDIGLVNVGDQVRLKAWANSDIERVGTVISIVPTAETMEFGRVVRVKTQFENENGFFRPGMTGFAKIDGDEMYAWQAFTRLFDRFFRIEVWGWIP